MPAAVVRRMPGDSAHTDLHNDNIESDHPAAHGLHLTQPFFSLQRGSETCDRIDH